MAVRIRNTSKLHLHQRFLLFNRDTEVALLAAGRHRRRWSREDAVNQDIGVVPLQMERSIERLRSYRVIHTNVPHRVRITEFLSQPAEP